MEISTIKMVGDSQLVVNQLVEKFQVRNDTFEKYHSLAISLIDKFSKAIVEYVPRSKNAEPNKLAHITSGLKISEDRCKRIICVEKMSYSSIL